MPYYIIFTLLILLNFTSLYSLPDSLSNANNNDSLFAKKELYSRITTTDGNEIVGVITKQDDRDVYITNKILGNIVISKYKIEEIVMIKDEGEEKIFRLGRNFGTRYFFTTNALAMEKGETYALWNWYGPEVHSGLTDNVSIGIITTWLASPIIGSVKYSHSISDDFHLGAGTLLGTVFWNVNAFSFALPYGVATFGDKEDNISVTAAYGQAWVGDDSGGQSLFSVGASKKISKKTSFIFDSYMIPTDMDWAVFFTAGLRWETGRESAFQIGLTFVKADDEIYNIPMPMFGWFTKL